MLAVFPPPRPSHIDASLALDIYLKINKTVTVLPILVFFNLYYYYYYYFAWRPVFVLFHHRVTLCGLKLLEGASLLLKRHGYPAELWKRLLYFSHESTFIVV